MLSILTASTDTLRTYFSFYSTVQELAKRLMFRLPQTVNPYHWGGIDGGNFHSRPHEEEAMRANIASFSRLWTYPQRDGIQSRTS